MIQCRNMVPGDINEGLRLCREAGWNQVERDWRIFLQLGPDACRVALLQKKVVGTVTTVSYQHSFSWIGMLLVDPAHQRQGIGMKLLKEALHILRNEETIKLDATPAGRPIYLKMDFGDEYQFSRMAMTVSGDKLAALTVKPLRKNDLPALIKFDQEIFGASRQPLLEWIWEGAAQYAFVENGQDKIQGYCLGRNGYNYEHIGPVAAQNISTAKKLVSAALHNCIGRRVILDALHFEPEWIAWLEAIGFVHHRLLTRMYRGPNHFPGIPQNQFAILGPEFG